MNRERAKELLPIIQAFAEGKEIEFIDVIDPNDTWDDIGNDIGLQSYDIEYRIKPEPEVIYVIDSKHGDGKIVISDKDSWPKYKVKKFQEVFEDMGDYADD